MNIVYILSMKVSKIKSKKLKEIIKAFEKSGAKVSPNSKLKKLKHLKNVYELEVRK